MLTEQNAINREPAGSHLALKGIVHPKMKIRPWFTIIISHPRCTWHSSFRQIQLEFYKKK